MSFAPPLQELQTISPHISPARMNSPAYDLWLHATAIQTRWNIVRPQLEYLRDDVVRKIVRTADEIKAHQSPADLEKSDYEATTEFWRTKLLGGAIAGLQVCDELLGENHPITLGFQQIQTKWKKAGPADLESISELGDRLLIPGEEMHTVLDRLLKQGDMLVQSCLEPTRILHLSKSHFRDKKITGMLAKGREMIQESMKTYDQKLAPYFCTQDVEVIFDDSIWKKAVRERQPFIRRQSEASGLHIKTFLQPPVIKKDPSTLNLSEKFGYRSGADELTILERGSPSLLTSQTMSAQHQEPQTIQSLSGAELPQVEAVTPYALDKTPALRKRADSAYTVNSSVAPPIPRRSSRRRSNQPTGASTPNSPSSILEPSSPSSPITAMMDWSSNTTQSRLSGASSDKQSVKGSLDGQTSGVVTGYLPSIHEHTIRTQQTTRDRTPSVGSISQRSEELVETAVA